MFFGAKQILSIIAILSLPIQGGMAATNQNNYRVQHQAPTVLERSKPVNLSFDIPAINVNNVQDAFLFYKYDGEVSYRQQRASFNQNRFNVELNIDNSNAGALEYYFMVEMNNGQQITWPSSQPESDPARIDIVDRPDDLAAQQDSTDIEYTILSPDPGSTIPASDALVALTLFYEDDVVDTTRSSFQLLLDEQDITADAEASNYFFSYSPAQIDPGQHHAALRLVSAEDTLEIVSWSFNILDPGQARTAGTFAEGNGNSESFVPEGQMELTAQNQQVGGIDNDVLKGNVRFSGRKNNIRYSAYGLLTSQESARLQPQNRYGAELYVGDWLEIQGGHIYPSLSRLSISGRRVQGINAGVHIFDGAINAQILHGKINRKITNLYDPEKPIEPSVTTQSDGTPVDTTYSLSFASGGTGTFKRDVTGGRLSFGRGQTFQWGVNFLKVRDDTTSLATIRDFNDLMSKRPELANTLEARYRSDLQTNPDLLSVSGNPQPKDNFIAGSDLMFNIFDNALEFRSETSVSLLNEDISSGVLANGGDFDININEDISNDLDRWSWLIIINENMNALPLRFDVQNNNTEVESVYFPTSILANQSELNVDLWDHSLRAQYRWIGPNYVSLANSTIRRDVAGVTLSDRFQLFQNRLYVTLGYENLNDNVSNTKDATTNTQTARTNVSWFPIDQYLPRVSVGFMYRNRDNAVELYNPFVQQADQAQDIAVRNFNISQGDTLITANPKFSNTSQVTTSISQQFNLFDLSHDASLNVSYLNTKDDFFRYGDTQSSSVNFSVQSRFSSLPLNTRIGFNLNNTETLGGLSNVKVLGFNIGGTLILMDDKLNLDANVAMTSNKIESTPLQISNSGTNDPKDDVYQPKTDSNENRVIEETNNNLVIFRAGAQYNLNTHHAFMVNLSYTNISNQLSGLNPPNDHRLQARYIYRF